MSPYTYPLPDYKYLSFQAVINSMSKYIENLVVRTGLEPVIHTVNCMVCLYFTLRFNHKGVRIPFRHLTLFCPSSGTWTHILLIHSWNGYRREMYSSLCFALVKLQKVLVVRTGFEPVRVYFASPPNRVVYNQFHHLTPLLLLLFNSHRLWPFVWFRFVRVIINNNIY